MFVVNVILWEENVSGQMTESFGFMVEYTFKRF